MLTRLFKGRWNRPCFFCSRTYAFRKSLYAATAAGVRIRLRRAVSVVLTGEECAFSYRHSRFKAEPDYAQGWRDGNDICKRKK